MTVIETGLRVCMLSGFRPTPGGGGTEKHIFELAVGLLARGVEVDIICEDRSFLPDQDNPLALHLIGIAPESLHAPNWLPRYLEKSKRFAEVLDPARYGLVHCHSHYGYHTALKLARQLNRAKSLSVRRPALVTTYHLTPLGGLRRLEQLGMPLPEGEPIDRAVSIMEETVGLLSDRCIAVSRGVAREVEELYGVPKDRIDQIYNWFDPSIFYPRDQQAARRRLGLVSDAWYLLYVGHFNHFRGQIVAETLRQLPDHIRLVVVDPEPDAAMAAEFGERVVYTGYLTPSQMAEYFAAADLQCFSPVYSAFGLVLIEGMACGCPAVVFNLPAMNEIVTPESGYLVEEANAGAYARAVHTALSDTGSKRRAAVERAGAFVMDAQVDRVLQLYQAVKAEQDAPRSTLPVASEVVRERVRRPALAASPLPSSMRRSP